MSMQVKKEGQNFKFNFNGAEIDTAQVTGAIFTIRTMTPVTDLPQILGLQLIIIYVSCGVCLLPKIPNIGLTSVGSGRAGPAGR